MVSGKSGKPFDKPWFYANWVAFTVALILMTAQSIRHPDGPNRTLGLLGIALISIAIHAVYAGYFAVRSAVITREERPGQFWFAVIAFVFLGLTFLPAVLSV